MLDYNLFNKFLCYFHILYNVTWDNMMLLPSCVSLPVSRPTLFYSSHMAINSWLWPILWYFILFPFLGWHYFTYFSSAFVIYMMCHWHRNTYHCFSCFLINLINAYTVICNYYLPETLTFFHILLLCEGVDVKKESYCYHLFRQRFMWWNQFHMRQDKQGFAQTELW